VLLAPQPAAPRRGRQAAGDRRARGAGLGRRLIAALEDHAHAAGFRLLTLDTRRGDVAERLYRRLGWCAVGTIPDHAILGDEFCDTVLFYKRL
jgi:GNAT superfamily N-acetyltransferase